MIPRRRFVPGYIALALLAAVTVAAFRPTDYGDYGNPACVHRACGDARPAIVALSHGDFARFFRVQPAMGSLSLVVRAPAAFAARELGAGDAWQYRAGAFLCVLGAALLGGALAARMIRQGRPVVAWLPVAVLCVVNPANGDALQRGHPEEVLGAALLAAAALAASRRPAFAGVLIGLAMATKQWALLGLLPIAFMAPAKARLRTVAVAAGIAALFAVPMAIGNPGEFADATAQAAAPPGSVKPVDIWYPIATRHHGQLTLPDGTTSTATWWTMPHSLDLASHWIVLATCVGLFALWCARRERAGPAEWLLAATLLFRVLGDPHAQVYHHAPFVLALAVAEVRRRHVFPWATVGASALLAVTLTLWDSADSGATDVMYLSWAIPALVVLAAAALGARVRTQRSSLLR